MAKKQFQHNNESISTKRIIGAALALVVFFLLLTSVVGLAQKYFAIKHRSRELVAEQATLAAKQNDLAATNTPEGTEESLRERYNYLKPGEQMIIITPDNTLPPPPAPESTVAHWWDELLHGLGIRK
jgi:cell division protein FtsB